MYRRTRRPTRTVTAALIGVLATMLAASACTSGTTDGLTASASDTPTTSSEGTVAAVMADDAPSVRAAGAVVASGLSALAVRDDVTGTAAAVEVVAEPDASTTFTVPFLTATIDPVPVVSIASPEGTTFTLEGDGSVSVIDAAGAFVGGLGAPTAVSDDGTSRRARFEAVGADVLRVVVTGAGAVGSPSPAGTVTGSFATVMLESATWGDREGGLSLAVDPTPWARYGGLAAQEGIWAAVIAVEPDADTPGMRAQMLCHALGAPDKETWNLEPWRPDVDGLTMITTKCNPT